MNAVSKISAGLRLTVAAAMLCGSAFALVYGIAPIALAPVAYGHAKQQRDAEAVAPVREAVFRDVCPAYRDTTTWKRWTDSKFQSLSWCDEYLHRL